MHPPAFLLSDCVHGISDHTLKSISDPKFPPSKDVPARPCERGIISAFVVCLLKDKLLVYPEIPSVPAILIILFLIKVPCTDSCPWFSSPLNLEMIFL
jgi:hypothetical protein